MIIDQTILAGEEGKSKLMVLISELSKNESEVGKPSLIKNPVGEVYEVWIKKSGMWGHVAPCVAGYIFAGSYVNGDKFEFYCEHTYDVENAILQAIYEFE